VSTEKGFHRHGSNSYIAEFAESEREILLNLIEQLIELLSERVDHGHEDPLAALVGITSHDSPPEDEVLRRLLPNAYADEVDASEFRRYTESTLRGLALGVRLNVQQNSSEFLELLSPDDPLRGVYAVYTWLGWLQESLLSALMDE